MQKYNHSDIVNNSVENRINQLKIQIKILEEQLESSKRDLRKLERSKHQ